MVQIHKAFTDEQVRELMQRYVDQQVDRKHLQELLGIKERRFFDLLKKYREDPQNFTIQYHRRSPFLPLSIGLKRTIFTYLKNRKNPSMPGKS